MKVSIQHTERTTGVLRRTTIHGVVVRVDFSEEEQAIIVHRNLKYDVVLERGYSAELSNKQVRKQENRGIGRKLITAAVSGMDANSTNLTINKLLKGPDTYFLDTPLEAKVYEDELRKRLVQLKDYIVGNEGIVTKSSSFEL